MEQYPSPSRPFSWGSFISALFGGLLVGGFLAFFAGFAALATEVGAVVGWFIGALPGLIMGFIGWRALGRGGWGEGLLVAACVIALIGGICGGMMGRGLG